MSINQWGYFQRAYELLHGLSYIFLTPTMQLLLVSYTMCTLNTISWGVRESAPAPPEGATDGHVNLGFTGANNEDDPSIKVGKILITPARFLGGRGVYSIH